MQHASYKMTGLALVLALALVGGIQAQQKQQEHQEHHPEGAQTPQQPPAKAGADAPAQPQQMQGMLGNMQGMMEHMQGMMERMQGMMGRQGMGMSAQGEQDDEEAFPQRGMMGRRGMMGMGDMMGSDDMMGSRGSSNSLIHSRSRYGHSCVTMPRRPFASEQISACWQWMSGNCWIRTQWTFRSSSNSYKTWP